MISDFLIWDSYKFLSKVLNALQASWEFLTEMPVVKMVPGLQALRNEGMATLNKSLYF
jgi:hypothetical protein